VQGDLKIPWKDLARWFATIGALATVFAPAPATAEHDLLGHQWDQCETHTRQICGTWTRRGDGQDWSAQWSNGAVATLTMVLTGRAVTVTRNDTSGPSRGLRATYRGMLSDDGTRVDDGKVDWCCDGFGDRSGTWTATLRRVQTSARPTQPPAPARPDRSRETLEALGVPAELLPNPQRLVSMLESGQLTPGEVRALERGWRERAETLEFLVRAWDRLLVDRDLIAIALSTSSVSAGGGPPDFFSVEISGPDGERALIDLDLFAPDERFFDPGFVLLPGSRPGHLMALLPLSELRSRLAGPDLIDAALFPLYEHQIELVLDLADIYGDHARDERFGVQVELDQLRQILRTIEQLEETRRLR